MIRLILLDIDGVVMGSVDGVNFPLPSKPVTKKIKEFTKSHKAMICLCTGKTSFVVANVVRHLDLNSFHITDGGAVIFNPLANQTLTTHYLPQKIVEALIYKPKKYLDFWQIYTPTSKFVLKNKFPDKFQETGMAFTAVENFNRVVKEGKTIKIELIYTPEQATFYQDLFSKLDGKLNVQWTEIPRLLTNKIIIVTAKDVDKRSSVEQLLSYLKVNRKDVLAVGDTLSDWKFIEGAKYIATLKNAGREM
jgi:hydroxymethylpyrimidine pyrophosphatase-like HAD family hydrolase